MPWNTYWTIIAQILIAILILAAPVILFFYVLTRSAFDAFHHAMVEGFANLFERARKAAAERPEK